MRVVDVGRLGADAELRYTADNTPVVNMSVAFDYGRAGETGNRPTQWAKLSYWGRPAEALAPHLRKGRQLDLVVTDMHMESYDKDGGGKGWNLVGRVLSLDFVGPRPPETDQSAPAPAARRPAPAGKPADSFPEDDDIPF